MRTTVTLDPDVEAMLRKLMKHRGLPFKAALNQAIREGLSHPAPGASRPYTLKTFRMGYRPEVALDQALSLAAALEDEPFARSRPCR